MHNNDSVAVSIIVPLYHAVQHVPAIVGAIKAQTWGDFEALLINGDPDAETARALEAAIAGDARFTVIEHPNQGAGAARNVGLDVAQGEFVAFFDADDVAHPELLERALAVAQSARADVVVFQSEHLDDATGEVHPSPDAWDASCFPGAFDPRSCADDLFGTFRNWLWDKLFRRSHIEREGLRFPALMRSEDLPFTCLAMASAGRIALLDEVLYSYRVNSAASATSTHGVAPTDIIEGCRLLKAGLEERGLMETYRSTYTQWAGLACSINLVQMRDAAAFGQAYNLLHGGGLHELELDACSRAKLALPAGRARKGAAGDIDDADIWAMLGIVEVDDLAAGTFNFMQYRALLDERRHKRELAALCASRTYRLGSALVAPIRAVGRLRKYTR